MSSGETLDQGENYVVFRKTLYDGLDVVLNDFQAKRGVISPDISEAEKDNVASSIRNALDTSVNEVLKELSPEFGDAKLETIHGLWGPRPSVVGIPIPHETAREARIESTLRNNRGLVDRTKENMMAALGDAKSDNLAREFADHAYHFFNDLPPQIDPDGLGKMPRRGIDGFIRSEIDRILQQSK